jgi:hypothetical protein
MLPGGGYPGGPGAARRSKLPYVIGALLMAVGVIGGITTAVLGINTAMNKPSEGHQFAAGETTTVHLVAGESQVIYVSTADSGGNGQCATDSKNITLDDYSGSLTINQWRAALTITANATGDSSISCTGGGNPSFVVAGDAFPALTTGIVGAVVGGLLSLVGVVVIIVTAIRRRNRPQLVPAYR